MTLRRPAFNALHQISLGWWPGYSTVSKFGQNLDVDAASAPPEDIWPSGGVYTGFPSGVAEPLSVVSTSAADTAAGTGLRAVYIEGLDASGTVQSETVTLSGLTPVVTASTWTRCHVMIGVSVGSGATNAGVITAAHSVTTADVFAVIPVGIGRTVQAVYTVPAGCVGLLLGAHVGVSNNNVSAQELVAVLGTRAYGSGLFVDSFYTTIPTGGPVTLESQAGVRVPALTDIVVRAVDATIDSLAVTALLELVVVPT